MVKVSVSLLNARNDLVNQINELNKTNIDYIHLDIMDYSFVPYRSFTDEEIETILKLSTKRFDVHLMVSNPDGYIYNYKKEFTEYITIHYEVMKDINILSKIRNKGIKCGISIKPDTDIEKIYELLDKIDLVLVMSVEPGRGGQYFMDSSLQKIEKLKEEIIKRNLNVLISVDGGINIDNKNSPINAGADMIVIGSALTKAPDKLEYVNKLKMIDT